MTPDSPALEIAGVTLDELPAEVTERLERDRKGHTKPCLTNLIHILHLDPAYQDRLWLDVFRRRVMLDGAPITDEDETALNFDLSQRYGIGPSTRLVGEAVRYVARERQRHPVQEYLSELTWDQVERTPHWLEDHLGAEGTAFVRAVAKRFLIAAVARIIDPGCKVDTTLVLQGPQGIGKSQAFAALAGREWFSDSPIDFGTKDAFQNLPGVWFYELAELDSLRRSESSAIKAFLSAQVDHYRPSYGRNTVDVPRQNVFVGTTNEAEFLRDPTGSRRFWPVAVDTANVDGIRASRDQLWAEAMVRYHQGEEWWLTPDEEHARIAASEPYRAVDAWEEPIRRWLEDHVEPFTIDALLSGALGKETARHETRDAMRAAGVLSRLGLSKKRVRVEGVRRVLWAAWDAVDGGAA
jgi:putative DNA primase/helicase